jgi:hypothetical protein
MVDGVGLSAHERGGAMRVLVGLLPVILFAGLATGVLVRHRRHSQSLSADPSSPTLTDWEEEVSKSKLGLARAVGLEPKILERRAARRVEQQRLLDEEHRREPTLSDASPPKSSLFPILPKCRRCGNRKALELIDRRGILLDGHATYRCRYCLAWSQHVMSGGGNTGSSTP